MGCSTDIDLVLAVSGDPHAAAISVESFIRSHAEWYVYDTDFAKAVVELRGPLDMFVVNQEVLWQSLEEKLSQTTSVQERVDSYAVWLLIRFHRLKIGANFALGFEPLALRCETDCARFARVRRDYALNADAEELVEKLKKVSLYHEQLLSNPAVRENVLAKLRRWSDL